MRAAICVSFSVFVIVLLQFLGAPVQLNVSEVITVSSLLYFGSK